jgi:DNA polymerase III subunit delta'
MVKNWETLRGTQPTVVQTIKNAFLRDRVAHAYLMEGPKGTGKMDAALLFAKSYFCQNRKELEPCNECINCKRINSRNHPDLYIVSPDGLSIKKEQIQHLQKEFSFSGFESNKKVYIIEHANKMSTSAANSLLKFLEEPSEGTVAILITEQIHGMLDTIISRCQLLSFSPLPFTLFVQQLMKEGVSSNNAKLIASLTSNLNEAIDMNEDEMFEESKKVVIDFSKQIISGSLDVFIAIQEKFLSHFKERADVEYGLDLLTIFFKDFLYAKIGKTEKIVFEEEKEYLINQSKGMTPRDIMEKVSVITEGKKRLRSNVSPQSLLEQIVINLRK